jgi:hypothetical protein
MAVREENINIVNNKHQKIQELTSHPEERFNRLFEKDECSTTANSNHKQPTIQFLADRLVVTDVLTAGLGRISTL